MKKFEVKNHEPSYLPDGDWRLVWHDEFDGTELDTSKWRFRLNFWGEPFDAYTDNGVVLDGNSHIELHRTEKNGCYVSPQLQTGSNSFDIPKGGTDNPWGQSEFWPLGVLENRNLFTVTATTSADASFRESRRLCGAQFKEEGRIYYDIKV